MTLAAPGFIDVVHVRKLPGTCDPDLSQGYFVVDGIETYTFDSPADPGSYTYHSLQTEWIPSWTPQALKAGAVAVRTHAWYKRAVHYRSALGGDITDSTADQCVTAQADPVSQSVVNAVNDTVDQAATYLGDVFFNSYRNDSAHPTADGTATAPPNQSVGEPATDPNYAYRNPGMSQEGTQRLSGPPRSWDYKQLVTHYYSRLDDENTFPGMPLALPHWRANFTDFVFPSPFVMQAGSAETYHVNVQNTGPWTWSTQGPLPTTWVRFGYRWLDAGGRALAPGSEYHDYRSAIVPPPVAEPWQASGATVEPGQTAVDNLVTVGPPFRAGTYTLRLSPIEEGQAWFVDRGWPGLDLTVTVVDTTPPANPSPGQVSSSSHTPTVWSATPQIAMAWAPGSDAAGIAGYSILWDTSPSTLPPAQVNATGLAATSSPLASGSYTFHLRAQDINGNWATGATHQGPYWVDVDPPADPSATSATHTPGTWSTSATVSLSWVPPADLSGVNGYSYAFDTPADATVDTTATALAATLGDGSHTFFLRARDAAGNWSAGTASLGPLLIDTTPPGTTALSAPATTVKTWFVLGLAANDATSAVAAFDLQYRTSPGSPWQDWGRAWGFGALFQGQANTAYELRSRAVDWAGNVGAYPAGPQATVQTGADASGLGRAYFPLVLKEYAGGW